MWNSSHPHLAIRCTQANKRGPGSLIAGQEMRSPMISGIEAANNANSCRQGCIASLRAHG